MYLCTFYNTDKSNSPKEGFVIRWGDEPFLGHMSKLFSKSFKTISFVRYIIKCSIFRGGGGENYSLKMFLQK